MSTVTRNRDGVPGWGGEPSSWSEYKAAARLYVASTKVELRYTCGPRLAAELTGAARTAIQGQKSTWLSGHNGAETLLRHLQQTIAEPALPEVGNFMRQYFRVLRRKKGESMTAFCVRHREEYDRMCRSLGRMLREHGQVPPQQTSRQTARVSDAVPPATREEEPRPSSTAGASRDTGGQPTTEAAGDTPEASNSNQNDRWQWSYGNNWWSSWHTAWGPNWYGSSDWYTNSWQRARDEAKENSTEDEDDDVVQVLPDAVQGWFLLD